MTDVFSYEWSLKRPLWVKKEALYKRTCLHINHHGFWAEVSPLLGLKKESKQLCYKWAMFCLKEFSLDTLECSTYTNALLNLNDQVVSTYNAYYLLGYRVFKVKCGRLNFDQELAFLSALFGALHQDSRIRLDMNQFYTIDQCHLLINQLGTEKIDYLEEPTSRPDEWTELKCRVAIDESKDRYLYQALPAGVDVLVLKPMVNGLDQLLLEWVLGLGVDVTVSSSYEGPLGTLQLMALIDRYFPDYIHGINTIEAFDLSFLNFSFSGPCYPVDSVMIKSFFHFLKSAHYVH